MKQLIISMTIITAMLFAGEKIAIAVKMKGDVSHIHADKSQTMPLKLGAGLANEDKITTGEDGFAVIMFLDDKTIVKIREYSDFLVGGTRSEGGINKRVQLDYGKMMANVSKQKGKEFIIATPTSVASVKGTKIIVVADPLTGDMFSTLTGSIVVTNNVTGDSTEVNSGETANSTLEGVLDLVETDEESLPTFDDLDDIDEEYNELRFEIEDAEGNLKEIIIRYE